MQIAKRLAIVTLARNVPDVPNFALAALKYLLSQYSTKRNAKKKNIYNVSLDKLSEAHKSSLILKSILFFKLYIYVLNWNLNFLNISRTSNAKNNSNIRRRAAEIASEHLFKVASFTCKQVI